MKIKIITVMSMTDVGGAVTHMNNLSGALAKRGHSVEIVSAENVTLLKRMLILASSFFNKDIYRCRLTKFQISQLRKKISNFGEDIIHAHDALACLAAKDDSFLVWTVHGPIFEEAAMQGIATVDNNYGRLLLKIQAIAAARADKIICVDQGQKDILVKYCPESAGKVFVIPNSAYFDISFASDEGKKYILCARRLVEKNGVATAIKAFELIERDDLELWIVGDGPLKEKFTKYIEDKNLSNRVKLLGEVHNRKKMGQLTANASIILVPSVPFAGVVEATSIAALEGMLLSRPVVASNIGGLAEIIENNRTGLLVEPNNPVELAEAILRLLDDPDLRLRLGKAAFEVANNKYGTDVWLDRVEKVYNSPKGGNENSDY